MTLLREFGLVVENGSVRSAEKTIDEMTPRAKEIYAEKIKEGLGL